MALNLWWLGRPNERFWMEITDRTELGDDLYAPQRDGVGKEQWSYTLVTETRPGDIVLHWHKTWIGRPALVGWSQVTGPLAVDSITWQARGTRGRARGVATTGESWRMQCGGFNAFDRPLTLADLNANEPTVRGIHDDLQRGVAGTLYFPLAFYRPGELRARQGYLTKFPAALVAAFPQLAAAAAEPGTDDPTPVRRAVGMPRTPDAALRKTIEQWAVKRAIDHYFDMGATRIEELGKPYDLIVHGLGPVRHVEVKGSSVEAVAVELPANEVTHARTYPHTDLVVVQDIAWRRDGDDGYVTSGGRLRIWESRQPDQAALAPTQFRYDLPS